MFKLLFILSISLSLSFTSPLPDSMRLPSATGKSQCNCTCEDVQDCKPLVKIPEKEIFGFVSNSDISVISKFPLDMVTSIAWAKDTDICVAHQNGTRIIGNIPLDMPLTSNKTERKIWVESAVQSVVEHCIDGLTFDYELAIPVGDPKAQYYVEIVNETTQALKSINPGYQISVCVGWGPGLPSGIDGRAYDYKGLADVSDFLYVMQYDTRSQIFDKCVASANCPIFRGIHGIQQFLDLGISSSKLVMGIPWYGYSYPCEDPINDQIEQCNIKQVPWRGVNCSDAAGHQIGYGGIRQIVNDNKTQLTTEIKRDSYTRSMYFNYKDKSGILNQMWYDDPGSCKDKALYANQAQLRGIGPFRFDLLDLEGNPEESKEMWDSLRPFLDNNGNHIEL